MHFASWDSPLDQRFLMRHFRLHEVYLELPLSQIKTSTAFVLELLTRGELSSARPVSVVRVY